MPSIASVDTDSRSSRLFSWLLIVALIGVSNMLLVNNVLAIKLPSGQNLVGIRDLSLLLILGSLFLPMARARARSAFKDPVVVLTTYFAILTPFQGLVAVAHGADRLTVIRECFTMICWLLPLAVAVRLKAPEDIERVARAILVLSCLLSLGVFAEAATLMRWRVVTSSAIVEGMIRPQPNGYTLMVVATSLSLVRFLRPETGARERWTYLAVIALNFVAFLVTQSRTYVVGFLGSMLIYLALAGFFRPAVLRMRRMGTLVVLVPLIVVAGIGAFSVANADFRDQLLTRYRVFQTVTSAVEYTETDTRRLEVEHAVVKFAEEPIVGVGLGAPYRQPFEIFQVYNIVQDDGTIIHNVLGFFLVRFGLIGFVPFLLFCAVLVGQIVTAVRDRGAASVTRIGLAVGLVNLLICGLFANIFGVIEGVPGTMIMLGCCVACGLLDDRRGESRVALSSLAAT